MSGESFCSGRAVVYQGDALELLASGVIGQEDALVTDPPYGVGYDKGSGGGAFSQYTNRKPIHGDDKAFDPAVWLNAFGGNRAGLGLPNAARGKPVVIWGANFFNSRLPDGARWLIWDKSCGAGAATTFTDAELAYTNRKNPRCVFRHFWSGALRAGIGNQGRERRTHPAQKPVELMAWCIETARIGIGKTVLDPYMGVGTTGVAALMTGRRFVGVEIDAEYFDRACERLDRVDSMIMPDRADEDGARHDP